MADTILSVLQKKLREDMNAIADDMAGGACRSFEEYQKLVGIIEGLARAERELLDLVEAQEKVE